MYKLQKINVYQFPCFVLAAALAFSGCIKNRDKAPAGEYARGVLIVNEGSFNHSNGEISYLNKNTQTVTNKLFQTVNKRPLGGDVVQSMTVVENTGYIVCNNSNKIEIVNAGTFESAGVIENLKLPRYMIARNGKGYVSEWVSFSSKGRISVIDLASNALLKTIEVGRLPEQMAISNNKLYVANSGENFVSVINLASETFEKNIIVADAPSDFALDSNAKLWVLCKGKKVYDNNPPDFIDETASTSGALVRVNPATETTELTLPFSSTNSPEDLQINGLRNKLYYSYAGAVYTLDITAQSLPARPLISRSFYGLGIDPFDDMLYGAEASFPNDGKVIRYNPATGTALDSVMVTIGPNGFVFR
jgi:YVTN family beta-propeller protein